MVTEIAGEVDLVCEILQDEHQALWAVLRSSVSQKLDYWLTLVQGGILAGKGARILSGSLEL